MRKTSEKKTFFEATLFSEILADILVAMENCNSHALGGKSSTHGSVSMLVRDDQRLYICILPVG